MDDLSNSFSDWQERLAVWFDQILTRMPEYLLAIFVIILFYVISRFAKRLSFRLFQRMTRNAAINNFLAHVTAIFVILLGLFVALDIVDLDKTFTSLLAGAGILGLAFSLGFQDVVANFVSSFMIATRKPYRVGNIIESNNIFGTVKSINMRSTHIDTPQGQLAVIPNRNIYQDVMINYSARGMRRIDLKVGVSYGENLKTVKSLTVKAIKKIEYLMPEKKIELFFTEFGDYAIEFVVRYWIRFSRQPDYLIAVSDGIENIKSSFDENGITIPFPIRTLDFEIKRGKSLEASLMSKPESQTKKED